MQAPSARSSAALQPCAYGGWKKSHLQRLRGMRAQRAGQHLELALGGIRRAEQHQGLPAQHAGAARGRPEVVESSGADPAHDPDFGVGDFPALLDKRQADIRYLKRLRSVGAASAMADGMTS